LNLRNYFNESISKAGIQVHWIPAVFFVALIKFLIEAKYSINSFLGVCSMRTMPSILWKEKKNYTFGRLDNVIQIGYDARTGFD
jgi:hypothetical protein